MSVVANRPDIVADVEQRLECFREELSSLGVLCHESERVDVAGSVLSIASSVGGKDVNQDSAVLWVPENPSRVLWAAAIADGVSRSFEAGLGSRLACHAALAFLSRLERQPQRKILRPLSPCAAFFRSLGSRISKDPDYLRPQRYSDSNWLRCLRDGRLLQTTLLLAWQIGPRLYVDGVGDGGFLLSFEPNSPPMAFLPSAARPVNCFGISPSIEDCEFSHEFSNWRQFSAFTDGVTVAVNESPDSLLDLLETFTSDHRNTNPSENVIRLIERQATQEITDNLSMFAVSKRSFP